MLPRFGLLVIFASFALSGPVLAAPPSASGAGSGSSRGFSEAVREITDRYIDEGAVGPALESGLVEIVAGLDPHSYVLSPEQRRRQKDAVAAGYTTGLSIARRGDELLVSGVVPRSPAQRAGVRVGERVLSIDGTTSFASAAVANLALHGAADDRKRVALRDGAAAPRTLELALVPRQRVSVVESKIVQHAGVGVGVLCIHAFWAGTGDTVRKSLQQFRSKGVDAVVLDLRENPGGSLDEALVVADALVDTGVLMRTRGRHGRVLREELAHAAGTDTSTRIVALVDRHTASAAELVAMTLRDHKRAILIGERTYGKGTVQERFGLSDGSLLSLTIARYFGPADRTPDGRGLEPEHALGDEDMKNALARAVALAATP